MFNSSLVHIPPVSHEEDNLSSEHNLMSVNYMKYDGICVGVLPPVLVACSFLLSVLATCLLQVWLNHLKGMN